MSIPKLSKEKLFPVIAHLYRTNEPLLSKHALQRMVERSITEQTIEYIVTNALTLIGEPRYNDTHSSWAYRVDAGTGQSVVVTFGIFRNKPCIKVITVMHNNGYDEDNDW